MLTILPPLSTSELLDRRFQLYKSNLSLLYYDERVRKEGFDLQLMMSNLEPAAPTNAAVSAS